MIDFFSIWICLSGLNWFLFYFVFQFILLDSCSIWEFWKVLNWFLFYLDLFKQCLNCFFLCGIVEMSLIDFFSFFMFWNMINGLLFILLFNVLSYFFSIWIYGNVLDWFLFYLATGATSGLPLPNRPLFGKKRPEDCMKHSSFAVFYLVLKIDLNWFRFWLDCFEFVLIDFFSIWIS